MINYEEARYASEYTIALGAPTLRALKARRAIDWVEPVKSRIRILDLGCGEGALARTLSDRLRTAEIHACDISRRQIERARDIGGRITYRTCGGRLPYKSKFFHAVFVMDVLEHVPSPAKVASEVARVLKPNGLLLMHCPCEGQPWTLHWLLWRLRIAPDLKRDLAGHIQRFTRRQVMELMQRYGLICRHIRYSYHFYGQLFDLWVLWHRWLRATIHARGPSLVDRLLDTIPWYRIIRLAEMPAYFESRLLERIPAGMGLDCCFVKEE